MRYFKPKSLTFLTGVFAIAIATAMIFDAGSSERLGMIATVIAALQGSGDASPAGLYVLGFGLIGLRRRL